MVKGKNLTFTNSLMIKIMTTRKIPFHLFCNPVTFCNMGSGCCFQFQYLGGHVPILKIYLLSMCECMCVGGCVLCMWVHSPMHVCGGQRSSVFLHLLHLIFLRESCLLNLEQPWLASVPQGYPYLCVPVLGLSMSTYHFAFFKAGFLFVSLAVSELDL